MSKLAVMKKLNELEQRLDENEKKIDEHDENTITQYIIGIGFTLLAMGLAFFIASMTPNFYRYIVTGLVFLIMALGLIIFSEKIAHRIKLKMQKKKEK
jgi:uncharacterized membrane protein